MADTTSSTLTIKSVPKIKPGDTPKIEINGATFNWQTLQQVCQQVANAPADSQHVVTVQPLFNISVADQ